MSEMIDQPLPEKKEEPVSEPVKAPEPEKAEKAPDKGTQTPERNLYAALEEERRLRKEREREIEAMKTVTKSEDVFSDEGLALKREIDSLKSELESRRQGEELGRVFAQYPALQEVSEEFERFRTEYPNVSVEKVARLFMSEKGLNGTVRKGLETTSGGNRQPLTSGLSVEDVSRLRLTDFNKYVKLIQEGKIRSEDIK